MNPSEVAEELLKVLLEMLSDMPVDLAECLDERGQALLSAYYDE